MQREQAKNAKFLDQMIPLKGASHATVVSYGVDTPMRYSECFATLADGRVARLKDARQFIGWSGMNGSRRLLFRSAAGRILIPSSAGQYETLENRRANDAHKFITRDGGLLFVRRFGQEISPQADFAGAALA